jgi:type II secretory pathway component PulF
MQVLVSQRVCWQMDLIPIKVVPQGHICPFKVHRMEVVEPLGVEVVQVGEERRLDSSLVEEAGHLAEEVEHLVDVVLQEY